MNIKTLNQIYEMSEQKLNYWLKLEKLCFHQPARVKINGNLNINGINYNIVTGYLGVAQFMQHIVTPEPKCSITCRKIRGWDINLITAQIENNDPVKVEGVKFIEFEMVDYIKIIDATNEGEILMTKSKRYD